MFKFVRGYMETIDGVATYPMLSLMIFFVFFIVLFWWVLTTSKEHIEEVSNIPFENNNQPKT